MHLVERYYNNGYGNYYNNNNSNWYSLRWLLMLLFLIPLAFILISFFIRKRNSNRIQMGQPPMQNMGWMGPKANQPAQYNDYNNYPQTGVQEANYHETGTAGTNTQTGGYNYPPNYSEPHAPQQAYQASSNASTRKSESWRAPEPIPGQHINNQPVMDQYNAPNHPPPSLS